MALSLPLPELLASLANGQNAPLPSGLQDPDGQAEAGYSELDCLKDVIDDFPKLLTELKDPKNVQDATRALLLLVGVQSRLMGAQGGAPAQG